MDTLRMVKDYVDTNQTSSFGSYDLAVRYPCKVFGDGDLDRTLSDLGLPNRQALIIVRHNKVNVTPLHGQSSSAESNHSAIGFNEGYFSMIRRLFSYVNPLSYLGGSSNTSDTAQGSQNSIWQYAGTRHLNSGNVQGWCRARSSYNGVGQGAVTRHLIFCHFWDMYMRTVIMHNEVSGSIYVIDFLVMIIFIIFGLRNSFGVCQALLVALILILNLYEYFYMKF